MTGQAERKTCWVVSDGRTGIENQALGLAEAVDRLVPLDIRIKRITLKWPWRNMPIGVWGAKPFGKIAAIHDRDGKDDPHGLQAPWPDLWIASGRLSVPFSIAVRQGRKSFVVQTQDPRQGLDGFDLIVPPFHDGVSGANVIPIHGAPTRLTAEMLARDARHLEDALPDLPNPRVAVLIGGDSKAYRMTPAVLDDLIKTLKQLAEDGYGLMITTSRRTGDKNEDALRAALTGHKNVFFWDGAPVGDLANPYAGMLGLADHVLVTQESTNMVTEAATSGKPVHILPMERGNTKFRNFHDSLARKGITRLISLPLQDWSYAPLRETDRAARQIAQRWLGKDILS